MYLGYQNGKIKFYTEEELSTELYSLDRSVYTEDEYVLDGDEYILNDAEYKKKQRQAEEIEFNRKFFNTSLGYVRRTVTMKNGDTKAFLTDILPLLQVGIPVLTYTRELEQSKVPATQQFIDECGQQLIADFYGEID